MQDTAARRKLMIRYHFYLYPLLLFLSVLFCVFVFESRANCSSILDVTTVGDRRSTSATYVCCVHNIVCVKFVRIVCGLFIHLHILVLTSPVQFHFENTGGLKEQLGFL